MSSQSAIAAPGTLATAPLFLSSIVEPNVFFTLDDSGSMGWGMMVENGTGGFAANSGIPLMGNRYRFYYYWGFSNGAWQWGGVLPTPVGQATSWINNVWVLRNHNGNKNYYNPNVNYTPWAGVKANGTAMYQNADPTSVLQNPNFPFGPKVNLTINQDYPDLDGCSCWRYSAVYLPTYYTWTDTNGNSKIDATDAHTKVTIPAGTAEMQNFANWFQYYRNREFAAKAAIGRVINNTDATRMGLDIFNGGYQRAVTTMTNPVNKRLLLEKFYSINSNGGTPARATLKRVGDLFKSTGSGAPILPAVDGGECQQNFNILMTDGFWNGNTSPNVGNADANDSSNPFDGNATQSIDGGNYADSQSDTLADVAMYYYKNDLRPNLTNKVPKTPGVDEADHQHLVSYTISFGLNGTIDSTAVNPTDAGFTWPDAYAGSSQRVDDLWHAAYNGRGKYLSAQNPAELEASLNTSIANIAERTATAAAVSINSAKLTTESVVYLAQFNTNRWQGNLFAFKIADLTTGALSTTADWDAASVLQARNIATDPRTILTYNGTSGIPFEWSNLELFHKNDLKTSPGGALQTDAIGQARLAYLRGSRGDEATGNFFRERASLLGDLVNSGPVYVGPPALRWPDAAPFPTTSGSRYSDFKNGPAKTRDGVVYVGSNDGMLHGFLENGGAETIAYMPSNLFSTGANTGMHYLTDPSYTHKYYNDLTPALSDIYANLGAGVKWNTILISGQRGGGRGIYALNVTDPSSFSESNAANLVLWEFTHPDLGFTFSKPQIGMTNDGKWVAIFGNGYNDTGSGEAKLFILDIEKGVDGTWSPGDFREITTGSGTVANRNGLATPALADLDGNGTIDRVYAGDLKGQMWAFDLNNVLSSQWGVAGSGSPLFTTIGARPITTKPTLSLHPSVSTSTSNSPNLMVFFGSGQYLVNADKTTTANNYFYGIWDKGDSNITSTKLVQQTFDPQFSQRVLSKNTVNYSGGEYGWYFALPDSGERSVTPPVVRGDIVFFNSFVPNTDACSVGGYGFRFAVDLATGGATNDPVSDYNQDGVVDISDKITSTSDATIQAAVSAIKQDGFLPEPVFIQDIAYTAETPSKVKQLRALPTGRFSWQELL